jgi:hypothetical protein
MSKFDGFSPVSLDTQTIKLKENQSLANEGVVEDGEDISGIIMNEVKAHPVVVDEQRMNTLANEPILDDFIFRETTACLEDTSTFRWVETNKIIGRTGANEQGGGWSHEYEARKGRIAEIAKQLSSKAGVENVFHQEKPHERIKLIAINGPQGPMYTVRDGTHRIAGAKAAELSIIPCEVQVQKYPSEQLTRSLDDVADWGRKISRGLIVGTIEVEKDSVGDDLYFLHTESEVLPWMRTTSQAKFLKISQVYEKLYPGSLDKLSIPRDALIDPIANNYFMVGRMEEWQQKFGNSPRDQHGYVIYD